MSNACVRSFVAALGVLAATWVVGEAALRVTVRRDADGQEWLHNLRLRPYQLPLRAIDERLEHLERGTCFLRYDPVLGWAPGPGARSRDGLQRVDGGGIRTDGETDRVPRPGVLRVAIFGDSFTFGDEVRQDETWGAALERGLGARGIDAEVLNFGVNAYGIDQAYLRWQHVGRHYRPHVVVLGFQPEDVLRNLNVFRPLYFMDSEVPLSKPRFVVRDGALTLVNQPTIPPTRMRAALAAIRVEPLVPYERFFAPHASPWWMRDRVAATLATLVADVRAKPFHLDEEARELANRIVDAFADDVHAAGAAFLIVHLPRQADLTTLRNGRALWYDALLRDLDARHVIVRPEGEMPAEDAALFAPHGHYLPFMNALVGASLVDVTRRAGAPRTVSASRPASR